VYDEYEDDRVSDNIVSVDQVMRNDPELVDSVINEALSRTPPLSRPTSSLHDENSDE
jgi:hypothetical protein